ncbi:MAG TPA: PKD domain-containing protein [Thermoanaerobaculia bacterium]|nr:PKD domain-containing protein [Thermoanaerobaculia bacterium]
MRVKPQGFGIVLLAAACAFAWSGAAHAACGEASCVAAQGTYISHFTGANCDGTESYYLPYDGYAYNCRPWNGTGDCGTIHRTVTNRSYRYNGQCYANAWPSGNTLSDFVTVYRSASVPPVACGYPTTSSGTAPLGVWFYGNCSYDPDGGSITNYEWDLGDGTFDWGSNFTYHTYNYPGTYSVWLTVWDDEGQISSTFIGTIYVY